MMWKQEKLIKHRLAKPGHTWHFHCCVHLRVKLIQLRKRANTQGIGALWLRYIVLFVPQNDV